MSGSVSAVRSPLKSALVRSAWCLALAMVGVAPLPASAQAAGENAKRVLRNPPVLQRSDGEAIETALTAPAAPALRKLDLNIVYTDNALYDPENGRWQKVHLRSYTGRGVDPQAPFVAPTIEVSPGETVRITLHNKLPADPSCTQGHGPVNTPHCFNGTNLHSHGLWVSPTGNSDNVLLSINPGVDFQYEYNLPSDHPSGTFWYHTHRHGSTALQVSSGMGGALIVRGERKPEGNYHGDLDTLLKKPTGEPMDERLLVLQQIQYACVGPDGKLKYTGSGANRTIDWTCKPGETGVIESYDQFGPGTWAASGRYTSINGVVLPVFQGRSGSLERWRLIHAGVRDTITFQLRRMTRQVKALDALTIKPSEREKFANDACGGEPVPYFVVASDGLTMQRAQKRDATVLQPAYRNDFLVTFPEPGRYCVINSAAPAAGSVTQAATGRQVIGFVDVVGGDKVANIEQFVTDQLVKSAQANMPSSTRDRVIYDLKDHLSFNQFTPHPDVADSELKGEQQLVFFIDTTKTPVTFEVGTDQKDLEPYDPQRIDRTLKLGDAQTWRLESHFVSHPFHIHVNPFQIEKILDPNGKDVSLPGAVDDAGGGTPDPQYPGLKGVWKDTLWVKSLIPAQTYPAGVYKLFVRTRYERYIGEYVLHCHILDHEDQGMMQNVSIRIPDGNGGVSSGHH
jgi:FtsP/CotA-like multicopper oxidase with cupredoxin domain